MKFSKLFEPKRRDAGSAIPGARLERLQRSFRRRLSDDLEDVFHRACMEHDTVTAAGLLAVLEEIYNGRQLAHGCDRRINDESLRRARAALECCREASLRQARRDEALAETAERGEACFAA